MAWSMPTLAVVHTSGAPCRNRTNILGVQNRSSTVELKGHQDIRVVERLNQFPKLVPTMGLSPMLKGSEEPEGE